MINSLNDLCAEFGIDYNPDIFETLSDLSKMVYKGTDCGAWLAGLWDENDEIIGVSIGSIVEGSDFETSYDLKFPFKKEEFWDTIQGIEEECSIVWDDLYPDEYADLDLDGDV